MHKKRLIAAVLVLLGAIFGLSVSETVWLQNLIDPPPAGSVRVLEVYDGDTILVQFGKQQERVRLIGVDTPETNHPNRAVQCFGKAATEFLRSEIEGAIVRLESDPTNTNRDRYNRLLRYVFDENEILINQRIIELGYGFAYTAFPFQRRDSFVAAQTLARLENRGLWAACEIEETEGYINTVPASAAD